MSVSKLQRFGVTAPVGTNSTEFATTEFVQNTNKDVGNIMSIRGSNMYTLRTFPANLSNAGAGFTFQRRIDIPYVNQPILVRACYDNDTTGTFVINYVAFAGSSRTGFNPVDAGGSPSSWKVLTNIPVTAASANFATNGINGTGTSDWAFVNIPARTDGSEYGCLFFRTWSSLPFRSQVGSGSRPIANYATLDIRQKDISEYANSNNTSGNFTAFSPSAVNTQYYPGYIQILTPKRSVTIASCGDSTMQGLGSTSTVYGWPKIVSESLSSINTPVALQSWAYDGKRTNFFFGSVNNGIITDPEKRPDILLIQPYSQNNGYTQTGAESAWMEFLKLVQTCYRYGVQPIVKTVDPSNAINTTGEDAIRLWINEAVKKSNIPYIDYTSLVGSGVSPDRLKTIYSNDGVHLNDSGNVAAAELAKEVIRKFILV